MIEPIRPRYFVLKELRALRIQLRKEMKKSHSFIGEGLAHAIELLDKRIKKWKATP